jgi:hypothetical protein
MDLKRLLGGVFGEVNMRRLRRWQLAHTGHARWSQILAPSWERAVASARPDQRILIATNVGSFVPGATLESLLAVALTLRHAHVEILLCDAALPACHESGTRWHRDVSKATEDGLTRSLCETCFPPAERMYRALGLRLHRFSDFLTARDRALAASLSASVSAESLREFRYDGLALGDHALAGALRFYARGTLEATPDATIAVQRYLEAALLSSIAVRQLLRSSRFDAMVLHHGIYVPQGPAAEVAPLEGVRVVTWNPAYRKQCFIFSHGDTYHHTLMKEPVSNWETIPWSAEREARTLDYLKSRSKGANDWIWFHECPQEDVDAIARETGIDFSKPCVGLLTNVFWDAQLHYPANAFPDMLSWILETIEYFAKRPEIQLVIRIHPGEITGTNPTRQPITEEIRHHFPSLAPNVFVIPPDSEVSTYVVMHKCDSVIIYGTKTGVELTSLGIPVIVAGEAWIRNKGITLDAHDRTDYFTILDRLPLGRRMTDEEIVRARKYAYHFFFRRMIPVSAVTATGGWPPFRLRADAFELAAPGQDPGLDVICRGILEGNEFIFDESG